MNTHGIVPALFSLEEYEITTAEIVALCQKIIKREKLVREDLRLLQRIDKAYLDHYGNRYVKAFPKREWCRLSGRQYKVLNEQGERYGLNCLTEPEINLTDLPKQLHDLLCKIATKWDDLDSDDGMNGPASPWLEKYREQRAKQERLKLYQMRGELLPVDFVTEFWQRACAQIRAAGFKLEKQFGLDAKVIIDEAIDNIVADTLHTFGDNPPAPAEEEKTKAKPKRKPSQNSKNGNGTKPKRRKRKGNDDDQQS